MHLNIWKYDKVLSVVLAFHLFYYFLRTIATTSIGRAVCIEVAASIGCTCGHAVETSIVIAVVVVAETSIGFTVSETEVTSIGGVDSYSSEVRTGQSRGAQ